MDPRWYTSLVLNLHSQQGSSSTRARCVNTQPELILGRAPASGAPVNTQPTCHREGASFRRTRQHATNSGGRQLHAHLSTQNQLSPACLQGRAAVSLTARQQLHARPQCQHKAKTRPRGERQLQAHPSTRNQLVIGRAPASGAPVNTPAGGLRAESSRILRAAGLYLRGDLRRPGQ